MGHQITSEGGVSLGPASAATITAESAGDLSPSSPGHVLAEGGADLAPDAPADLAPAITLEDAILITGDATIEVDGGSVVPIAGYYFKTALVVEGKTVWSRTGEWPTETGLNVALLYQVGWEIDAANGLVVSTGWIDDDGLDVESPVEVENWVAGGAVTTGSFAMAAVAGIPAPDALAPAGGADLAPAAPGQITPESSY
jgi:hypothetical protein